MAEARLKGKLTMDDSQFQAVLRRSQQNAAKFASSLGRGVAVAGAVGFAATTAAAIATSAALASAVKQALDLGGKFSDLRSRTGASVKSLTIWSQALDDAGIGGDQLGGIINKLQKAIESGNPALEKMGLNLDELRKLTPDQQLARVGAAIVALKSPAQQTTAAMQIFGKSGGQLLTLFKDTSALENARNVLGSMPEILDANADRYDKVSDAIGNLQKKWLAFGVGLASAIPPDFDRLLDKILGADTAKVGVSLGKDIAAGFQDQSIYAAMAKLGGDFVKIMTAAAQSAGDIIVGSLTSAFSEPIIALQAKIQFLTAQLLRATGQDASEDIGWLDKKIAQETSVRDSVGRIGAGEDGLNFIGRKKQQRIDDYEARKRAALDSGNVAETEEQIKERIRQEGGPKVGFGEGKNAEERFKKAADRITATGKEVAPNTTAAIQEEVAISRAAENPIGPPMPPPFIGPPMSAMQKKVSGVGAFSALQSAPSAFERLQSAPSILSEPSVREPGKPRTTVARQERATKILGATATRKKKEEAAAAKAATSDAAMLKKAVNILESWDE